MGPSVKHALGVLEWFYMLTEKILFQKSSLVFSLPSATPLPGFGKRPYFSRDFFWNLSLTNLVKPRWKNLHRNWQTSSRCWLPHSWFRSQFGRQRKWALQSGWQSRSTTLREMFWKDGSNGHQPANVLSGDIPGSLLDTPDQGELDVWSLVDGHRDSD